MDKRTEIWSLNAFSMAFRWTFCAAVSKPDSGVHSSGVRTTPWTTSIPFRFAFFARDWRSLRKRSCTAGEAQRRWMSDAGSGRGVVVAVAARMADDRFAACGKMIAIGCFASEVACMQMLDTSDEVR